MANTLILAPRREWGDTRPEISEEADPQNDEFLLTPHPLLPADSLPRSAAGKEKKANRSGRRACLPPPNPQSQGSGPRRDDNAGGNGSGNAGRQGQSGAGDGDRDGGGGGDRQGCHTTITDTKSSKQQRRMSAWKEEVIDKMVEDSIYARLWRMSGQAYKYPESI